MLHVLNVVDYFGVFIFISSLPGPLLSLRGLRRALMALPIPVADQLARRLRAGATFVGSSGHSMSSS